VIDMKKPGRNRSAKIRNLLQSPYDKTLFLDTDTLVLEPIEEGFELLNKKDFAFSIDPYESDPIEGIPQSFPEANTGVLFYRNNNNFREFCDEWLTEFVSRGEYQNFRDQPFFRETLWNSDCKFAVLRPEWNLMVDYPTVADGRVKIAHTRILRSIDEHRYVNILKNINILQKHDNHRIFRPRVRNTIECIYIKPSIEWNSLRRLKFHLKYNGIGYTIKRIFDEIRSVP
jgi:alpha-N-acetylglucosamine transferase